VEYHVWVHPLVQPAGRSPQTPPLFFRAFPRCCGKSSITRNYFRALQVLASWQRSVTPAAVSLSQIAI
jgi:hypothetical protein